MTELRFEDEIFLSADLSGQSAMPAMKANGGGTLKYKLSDEAGLYIGFGARSCAMPSKLQDQYDSDLQPRVWKTAVLENDHLKATFLPDLGGKLVRLLDKHTGRDLVTNNPVIKPGNLAICNAWCSGGVEWNIGSIGHHVRTCRPMFMARAKSFHGTPVLRFYELSRENGVSYQLEFFLPDDSRFLFVRTRIYNHHRKVVPMYWWSNIAVDEGDDLRVVTLAQEVFSNAYLDNLGHILSQVKMPVLPEGYDGTYPKNFPLAKDLFFRLLPEQRKFEAAIYGDGWGLCQTSTDRLKGRKLFVWGRSSGGMNWQKRLTSPEGRPYVEIQAGLAHTQMECLPMPPRTAWEWMEAYGALQTDPEIVHGSDWTAAGQEVADKLQAALPRERMDALLAETREAFALQPAEEIISRGSGWGALEAAQCGKEFPAHLDFTSPDSEPAIWHELLKTGAMPDLDMTVPPPSYMVQDEYFELLKAAPANDLRNLQLGLGYYFRKDFERAEALLRSVPGYTALYALANTALCQKNPEKAAEYFRLAFAGGDPTVVREGLQAMCRNKQFESVLSAYIKLPEDLKAIPAHQLCYIEALIETGHPDEAEVLLMQDNGIELPQLQEGEVSLSNLYLAIRKAKAAREGKEIDPKTEPIPERLDYRMSHIDGEPGKYGARYPRESV